MTIGIVYYANRKKKNWQNESIIAASIIAFSLHLAFFVVMPVTIDRSISVFLLKNIDSHNQGVSKEELEADFVSQYVYANHAIDRRVSEQTISKNIETSNNVIHLSAQGKRLLHLLDFIKYIYNL